MSQNTHPKSADQHEDIADSIYSKRRLRFAAVGLFSLALIPDLSWHGLAIFGWTPLFAIFHKLQSLKKLVLEMLLINTLVSAVAYFWLLLINEALFLPAMAYSVWFLPIFFAVLYGVRLASGQNQYILPAFLLIFWPFYFLAARFIHIPIEVICAQFFSFSLPSLQILSHGSLFFVLLTLSVLSLNFGLVAAYKYNTSLFYRFYMLFFAVFFVVNFMSGSHRLSQPDPITHKHKRIAAIQHNLHFNGRDSLAADKYRQLATAAAKDRPDIIIFPLYTFVNSISNQLLNPAGPVFFSDLAREARTPILFATRVYDPKLQNDEFLSKFKVSAFLFSDDGQPIGEYGSVDKSRLHDRHQVLSKKYGLLDSPIGRLGILICYENIRPIWAASAKKLGAEILVGLANPADADHSALPYYLLRHDQMRAIESHLPLIRVTPNGFTALIDAKGRVVKRSHLRQEETLIFEV